MITFESLLDDFDKELRKVSHSRIEKGSDLYWSAFESYLKSSIPEKYAEGCDLDEDTQFSLSMVLLAYIHLIEKDGLSKESHFTNVINIYRQVKQELDRKRDKG